MSNYDESIAASFESAVKNHPCINCDRSNYCKDNSVACYEFVSGLYSGYKATDNDHIPNYHNYINAFIDKRIKHNSSWYVWARNGFAGVINANSMSDPAEALGGRYIVHKMASKSAAYDLELSLNLIQSMDDDHRIRRSLVNSYEHTTSEINDATGIKRSTITRVCKMLVAKGILTTGTPRRLNDNSTLSTTYQVL